MDRDEEEFALGLIVASRDSFPDELGFEGGKEVKDQLEKAGFKVITAFSPEDEEGLALDREDSKKYAELFKEHSEEISGILVTLPNFGTEKSVLELHQTLRIGHSCNGARVSGRTGKNGQKTSQRCLLR